MQGRTQAAHRFYGEITAKDGCLPARTVLIAARLGWSHRDIALPQWQEVDVPLREQAFLCAAAAGHVDLMQEFTRLGVPLDFRAEDFTLARVAATNGEVNVLRYLHNRGVDVFSSPGRSASDPAWPVPPPIL